MNNEEFKLEITQLRRLIQDLNEFRIKLVTKLRLVQLKFDEIDYRDELIRKRIYEIMDTVCSKTRNEFKNDEKKIYFKELNNQMDLIQHEILMTKETRLNLIKKFELLKENIKEAEVNDKLLKVEIPILPFTYRGTSSQILNELELINELNKMYKTCILTLNKQNRILNESNRKMFESIKIDLKIVKHDCYKIKNKLNLVSNKIDIIQQQNRILLDEIYFLNEDIQIYLEFKVKFKHNLFYISHLNNELVEYFKFYLNIEKKMSFNGTHNSCDEDDYFYDQQQQQQQLANTTTITTTTTTTNNSIHMNEFISNSKFNKLNCHLKHLLLNVDLLDLSISYLLNNK